MIVIFEAYQIRDGALGLKWMSVTDLQMYKFIPETFNPSRVHPSITLEISPA